MTKSVDTILTQFQKWQTQQISKYAFTKHRFPAKMMFYCFSIIIVGFLLSNLSYSKAL